MSAEDTRMRHRTIRGITYWPTFEAARAYANAHGLPTDRIIAYQRGYAIQRERSGPYWCINKGWQ